MTWYCAFRILAAHPSRTRSGRTVAAALGQFRKDTSLRRSDCSPSMSQVMGSTEPPRRLCSSRPRRHQDTAPRRDGRRQWQPCRARPRTTAVESVHGHAHHRVMLLMKSCPVGYCAPTTQCRTMPHAHDETRQLQQESRAAEVGALPPPRLCQRSHPCQMIRQRHSEQGRRAFLPALAKLRPLGIEAGAGGQSARLASPKEQFPPEGKEVPHSLRRWSLTPV